MQVTLLRKRVLLSGANQTSDKSPGLTKVEPSRLRRSPVNPRLEAAGGVEIGCAVLAHERAVGVGAHHLNVGAGGNVGGRARPDLEIDGHRPRFIDHVMAVAGAFAKATQSPASPLGRDPD